MGRNAAARTAGGDVVQRGQKVEEMASAKVLGWLRGRWHWVLYSHPPGQRPSTASLYLVCG